MKLLITLIICASCVCVSPDQVTTAKPSGTSKCLKWKRKLLDDWEVEMKRMKCHVNAEPEGSYCDPGPSCLSEDSRSRLDTLAECCTLALEALDGPSSTSNTVTTDEFSVSPQCSSILVLPNTLTSEEMRIWKELECRNDKIRKFREEIEFKWPEDCARSVNPTAPAQRTEEPGRRNEEGSEEDTGELSAEERLRLEERKAQLILEYERLEPIVRSWQSRGLYQYGAGPCNGRSREPFRAHRSKNLIRAGLEAMHENDCNRGREIQCEIYELIIRLHCGRPPWLRTSTRSPNRNCSEASE